MVNEERKCKNANEINRNNFEIRRGRNEANLIKIDCIKNNNKYSEQNKIDFDSNSLQLKKRKENKLKSKKKKNNVNELNIICLNI